MQIQFNFWIPTEVDYVGRVGAPSFLSKIHDVCYLIGKKVDEITYLGQKRLIVSQTQRVCHSHHCSQLQRRAIYCQLEKSTIIYDEPDIQLTWQKTTFKIILCCLLAPILFPIKACYKHFYIKSFFKEHTLVDISEGINFYDEKPTETLEEWLERYPNDPDLQCLDLCQQYYKLKAQFNQPTQTFYQDIKNLIQATQTLLNQNPNHLHAKALLKDIGLMEKYGDHFLSKIQDNEEWFDLFDLIQKESNIFPDLYKLFRELDTDQDKVNFRLLIQYIYQHRLHRYHFTDQCLVTLLIRGCYYQNDTQYIEIIHWLLDKAPSAFYFNDNNHYSIINLFYSHFLSFCSKPYSLNVHELEQRFLELDDGKTQEYLERRLLANLFGITGVSKIDHFSLELDGLPLKTSRLNTINADFYDNPQLNDLIYPILQSVLAELQENEMESEWLEQLIQLISEENSQEFDSILGVNVCDKKEKTHAWSQVRFNEYLLIGNQGYGCGDFPGVLIFKINSDHFSHDKSEKLDLTKSSTSKFFGGFDPKFLQQEYFNGLEAQYIGHLKLPFQKMGNCPWKAIKLNIFSTLFILKAYPQLQERVSFKKIAKQWHMPCQKLKKEITHPIRQRLLEQYLEKHENSDCSQQPDVDLIEKIHQKALDKNWISILNRLQDWSKQEQAI